MSYYSASSDPDSDVESIVSLNKQPPKNLKNDLANILPAQKQKKIHMQALQSWIVALVIFFDR